MQRYNVAFGAFVRGYAQAEFEAENDEAAKAKCIEIFKTDNGEDGLDWGEFDYENLALPSICSLQRLGDTFAEREDIEEGRDFAVTPEDARDFVSAEMLAMLVQCRAWINDECERRGKEDAEYSEPAEKIVGGIDELITRAQKVDG